jgi:hypothetical protein
MGYITQLEQATAANPEQANEITAAAHKHLPLCKRCRTGLRNCQTLHLILLPLKAKGN